MKMLEGQDSLEQLAAASGEAIPAQVAVDPVESILSILDRFPLGVADSRPHRRLRPSLCRERRYLTYLTPIALRD